ncbi:MAG TPA: hypothetical protein VE690_04820, partial [Rhodopila sp.]|nr:hypothetical protein [Rhodopila sp.]
MSLFSTKTIPPAPAAPPPVSPATRPLASAAAETTWIEAAEPFQCTSEVGLSQALYQLDSARTLHMARTTAAVRHFTLENVVLDSDSLRLFQGGELLAETAEDAPSWASEAAADPGTVPPQDDGSDFILGCNPAHADHRCWLTQCLPAIDWSLRLQAGRPARLVLPPLAPWQQESLDLLGYGGIPRLTLAPGTRIR